MSAIGYKWGGVLSVPPSEPIASCPAGAGVCVWLEGPFGGKGPQETELSRSSNRDGGSVSLIHLRRSVTYFPSIESRDGPAHGMEPCLC